MVLLKAHETSWSERKNTAVASDEQWESTSLNFPEPQFSHQKIENKISSCGLVTMLKGNYVYECVPELRGMIQVQV